MMEVFLIISALIFFYFGSLLLLSPESVKKISDLANKILFEVDEKFHTLRRPIGIILLALSIILWYIALWGKA